MGETRVQVRVLNLADAHAKASEPIECIVDTGATLTVVPARILDDAGIPKRGTLSLTLADGRSVKRSYGDVYLKIDGQVVPTRVIFGAPKDPSLLGVTALEMAGLMVDPIGRKLVRRTHIQQYRAALTAADPEPTVRTQTVAPMRAIVDPLD